MAGEEGRDETYASEVPLEIEVWHPIRGAVALRRKVPLPDHLYIRALADDQSEDSISVVFGGSTQPIS